MGDIFKPPPHPAPFDRGVEFLTGIHEGDGDLDSETAIKPPLAGGRVEGDEIQGLPFDMPGFECL